MTIDEVKTYLLFLAKYCKDVYNDVKVDEVLLNAFDIINHQNAEIKRLCTEKEKVLNDNNKVIMIPETGIEDVSDGYHTFNELYHHRAALFSVICSIFKDKAWKSKKHDTGDMFDGMFIVGIETPVGQITYHYDLDPYWNMFDVKELPNAPRWDGHTPNDVINRLDTLKTNNIISLSLKVGDTVYRKGDDIKKVYVFEIEHIEIYEDEIVYYDDSDNEFTESDIGVTVFLTPEDIDM